jgi:parallel beta-helix repeat protein
MKKVAAIFALALVVTVIATLASKPAPAAASHVNCGDTLTSKTQLHGDLTCTGTALIVGADNITLDLNGHTITGPFLPPCTSCPPVDGILVTGRTGVTIKDGTVRGFVFGIRLTNADNNVVKKVNVTDSNLNGISLFNDSDGNEVKECVSSNNAAFGVIVNNGSDGNTIKGCTVDGNKGAAGIFIGGGGTAPDNAPSTQNTLQGNVVSNNTTNGIFVRDSHSNLLRGNTVTGSGEDGLFLRGADQNEVKGNTLQGNAANGVLLARGAYKNHIQKNTIANNGERGIRVSATVPPPQSEQNVFQRNTVTGNVAPDIQDGTSGSGTAGTRNTYNGNTCGSSDPLGLCVGP